jgi:hypothetical protein
MTTLTIELADEVAEQLGERARCMGTTAEELLADCANRLIGHVDKLSLVDWVSAHIVGLD